MCFDVCPLQIAISGTYGVGDLKEDLKNMYNKAGLKNEKTLFLFTDSQVCFFLCFVICRYLPSPFFICWYFSDGLDLLVAVCHLGV